MKEKMRRTMRMHLRECVAYLMIWTLISGPAWAIDATTDVTSATGASATTTTAGGNTATTVNVTDSSAVINWSNFNTVSGETLTYESSLGNFAVLNRITGAQTSFDGILNGNQGLIIIINTNGIVFGPNAQITAAGFMASGLNMLDADFLSGNYTFQNGAGVITNKGTITADQVALIGSSVKNTGTITTAAGGYVAMVSGKEVVFGTDGSDVFVLKAVDPVVSSTPSGKVENSGTLDTNGGTVVLAAGDTFAQALDLAALDAEAVGSVTQTGTINAENLQISALKSVTVIGDLESGGDMQIRSADNAVSLNGNVTSGGDMDIEAGTYISVTGDATSGGTMSITTHDQGTSSTGSFRAEGDINLNTNLSLGAGQWNGGVWEGDQTVQSNSGTVTAAGWIHKETPGQLFITAGGQDSSGLSVNLLYSGAEWAVSNLGNIYVSGLGDIQLSGNMTGMGLSHYTYKDVWSSAELPIITEGGVSVISDTGAIYTAGAGGLNVTIEGYSNDVWTYYGASGVDLPDGPGKAAIVLKSADTLTLASDAELNAYGIYISANDIDYGVDDRAGIDFLDEDAEIGGYDRDQGIASDVAIYAGSVNGNVNVNGKVSVTNDAVMEMGDGVNVTVVFDAYNAVTMADPAYTIGQGGYRLEVASRITEWLSEAIAWGTLPSADDPAYMESLLGNDYVLRGAGDFVDYKDGADQPDNVRGRAWVLEDLPANPEPTVAALADLQIPELKGCPVELQAVAMELGVSPEDLQLTIGNSLATNPNIQPCEACSQIMASATILRDADGLRMAAMNQVFNTIAPANAPFTPEASASVVMAFNQLAEQDSQYAMAQEYIDAFVKYVVALDTQIKAPVGDPVAFVMEKYGASLTNGQINPNIAAYLMSRIQAQSGAM